MDGVGRVGRVDGEGRRVRRPAWAWAAVVVVLILTACAATPAAPTAKSTTAAAGAGGPVIVFERGGGLKGDTVSWTVYADGRVVDAAGEERRVDAAAVAALLERAESAGLLQAEVELPKQSQCRDCYQYRLRLSTEAGSNTLAFEDAQAGVPEAAWELVAGLQALLAPE